MLILNFFGLDIQIDCMANGWNRKCVTYFSRFEEEGSAGTNFFSQLLYPGINYYIFPPVPMAAEYNDQHLFFFFSDMILKFTAINSKDCKILAS